MLGRALAAMLFFEERFLGGTGWEGFKVTVDEEEFAKQEEFEISDSEVTELFPSSCARKGRCFIFKQLLQKQACSGEQLSQTSSFPRFQKSWRLGCCSLLEVLPV